MEIESSMQMVVGMDRGVAPPATSLPNEPERRLMRAVLVDALTCIQTNFLAGGEQARKDYDRAERWIASRDVRWLFSFQSICDALGVDAGYLRRCLREWRSHQARSAETAPRTRKARLRRVTGAPRGGDERRRAAMWRAATGECRWRQRAETASPRSKPAAGS